MAKYKLVSFTAVVALLTLVTLLIKLIRILLKWKYIRDKNHAILAAMLGKRSYFCLKSFVPVTRAGVFMWENFHLAYRDLGNWASPGGFSNEPIDIFTKEKVTRRDLGNRAGPVDWAHMKTPLAIYFWQSSIPMFLECGCCNYLVWKNVSFSIISSGNLFRCGVEQELVLIEFLWNISDQFLRMNLPLCIGIFPTHI